MSRNHLLWFLNMYSVSQVAADVARRCGHATSVWLTMCSQWTLRMGWSSPTWKSSRSILLVRRRNSTESASICTRRPPRISTESDISKDRREELGTFITVLIILIRLVEIAMEAMDLLLVACHAQTLNLFVESFLRMVQKLLEDSNPKLQILATNSVRFNVI